MLCSTALLPVCFEVPAEGYDGSEVTITFYTQQGTTLQDVLDTYIAEFNKLYPNIHVEHTTSWAATTTCATRSFHGYHRRRLSPTLPTAIPDHVALYNLAKCRADAGRAALTAPATVTRADGTHRDPRPDRRAEGRLHRGLLRGRPPVSATV